MKRRYLDEAAPYIVLLIAVFFIYSLVYANTYFQITQHNVFNSYSLQAYRWLQGYLDLGYNFNHLEIALYNNRYWISFPPLPSVIMLPLVAILGSPNTPDHIIALCVFIIVVVYAYKIAYHQLKNKIAAIFFALFLTIGSNYLQISMRGIVWHIAQNLAFMFTLMSIYYSITDNKKHSFLALFFLSCAMGCRPMNGIYIPLIMCLIYKREGCDFLTFVERLLLYSIPAVVLGAIYLILNYLRFGSIFEFGHNFLPASMAAEHGQLSVMYLRNHLRFMLLRIPTQLPVFSSYNAIFQPMAIWIISPIFNGFVAYLILAIRYKWEKDNMYRVIYLLLVPVLVFIHMLILASHKDVGGPQFGYRYTVDVLPVVFFGLLVILSEKKDKKSLIMRMLPLFMIGFVLNILGLLQSIGVR